MAVEQLRGDWPAQRQPRQLPVALAPGEAAFGVEHPGGTQGLLSLPSRHRCRFLVVSRAIESMLWMQLVFVRLAAGRRHRAAGR
jgi:hypothetical protein